MTPGNDKLYKITLTDPTIYIKHRKFATWIRKIQRITCH